MNEETARLVNQIRARLDAAGRRMSWAELAYGSVLLLGGMAGAWLLLSIVEAFLWLPPAVRIPLVFLFTVAAAGAAVWLLGRPLLHLLGLGARPDEEAIARRIGARFPEVSDRLLNLVQLARGRASDAPPGLINRALKQLAGEVADVPFEETEDFRRVRRVGRPVVAVMATYLFLVAVAPSLFLDANERLLNPATAHERPVPFNLSVSPGTVEVVRGDPLEITVEASGERLPGNITLALHDSEDDFTEELSLTPEQGVSQHVIPNLRGDVRYRAEAGRVRTEWHTVTVMDRPVMRGLKVQLDYPAYTGLPSRELPDDVGDIAALPGTHVSVDVQLGEQEVSEAFLRFDDGREVPLTLHPNQASGGFTLEEEGTYRVILRNERGLENRAPITYDLKLTPDATPSIAFVSPSPSATLDPSLQTRLVARMQDDHGFSQLRLYYRLAESRYGDTMPSFEAIDLPLDTPTDTDQLIEYLWQLTGESELDPVPGDVFEYYLQVWDNDRYAGFKSDRTATHRVRLPSLADRYEQLNSDQDEIERDMENLAREQDEMSRTFDEMREELQRNREGNWEDERQLEQLQEQQRSMEEQIEEIGRQIDDVVQQMEEGGLTSSETQSLYRELREVAQDIHSPELMEALEQLQQAMQELDFEQMQQAMQNFEFNEEQYRERLERALELFKRLRTRQQLEELTRQTENLSEEQDRLAHETGRLQEEREANDSEAADPSSGETAEAPEEADKQEELVQDQERARAQMDALEERLQELSEQEDAARPSEREALRELAQQMQQQDLPGQMEENVEQLRQGELQEAQQGQQQMQQQLQQMQQQMQQMQESMEGQQMQIDMAALRYLLRSTLRLSDDQEALRPRSQGLTAGTEEQREQARRQRQLTDGLRSVTDSLQQLAQSVPQLTRAVQQTSGSALQEMETATDRLSSRNPATAASNQQSAMQHLNELALLLAQLLDQMQGGDGDGQMSMQQMQQQLQQMAGNQQELNRQLQQMLNDMQGERLSANQEERLEQLARQQERIQQQLEQIREEAGEDGRQMLGDLERVADQMDETIQELRQQRQNRQTAQRQREILQRLLQAQQSLRTQGQDDQREGELAEGDYDREAPSELPALEPTERLRQELLRALESGYAPDYESLIRRYFELLQQREQEPTQQN